MLFRSKLMLTKPPAEDTAPTRPAGVRIGALIRVAANRYKGITPDMVMVVIADKISEVHAAPLGGTDRNSYWKIKPEHVAEVIPAARVTVSPA